MKDLLIFLENLNQNNRREWMDDNRAVYKDVREDFIDVVQELIDRRNEYDAKIENLEVKQTMFRINRDIRFGKNKTPYKPYMGAVFAQ